MGLKEDAHIFSRKPKHWLSWPKTNQQPGFSKQIWLLRPCGMPAILSHNSFLPAPVFLKKCLLQNFSSQVELVPLRKLPKNQKVQFYKKSIGVKLRIHRFSEWNTGLLWDQRWDTKQKFLKGNEATSYHSVKFLRQWPARKWKNPKHRATNQTVLIRIEQDTYWPLLNSKLKNLRLFFDEQILIKDAQYMGKFKNKILIFIKKVLQCRHCYNDLCELVTHKSSWPEKYSNCYYSFYIGQRTSTPPGQNLCKKSGKKLLSFNSLVCKKLGPRVWGMHAKQTDKRHTDDSGNSPRSRKGCWPGGFRANQPVTWTAARRMYR